MHHNVSVLTAPHIDESVDQNPRVVQGNTLYFQCPVLGNPQPTVEWRRDGKLVTFDGRVKLIDSKHLEVNKASKSDEGRYTCHAFNDAGNLDTDFKPEVIAPPKFHREGESVYEVIEFESVTLDCAVSTEPKPEINWFRGDSPLYLAENRQISLDGMKLTITGVKISDGGKYMCKASNEAGTSDIDLILKVLVPPKIDKSNIIGNPLAIVDKGMTLECPVTGIPQPTVTWTKDGRPLNLSDSRFSFSRNNEIFAIDGIKVADAARYTCVASNKGGSVEQDFMLEVLSPPSMETMEPQSLTKREKDSLTLQCPVRTDVDSSTPISEVSWIKDGRPIDPETVTNIKFSADGRRLSIASTLLADAGAYTCIASNRAGESMVDFRVEILCTNIASEMCRDLEYKHISRIRAEYNQRQYIRQHPDPIPGALRPIFYPRQQDSVLNEAPPKPAPARLVMPPRTLTNPAPSPTPSLYEQYRLRYEEELRRYQAEKHRRDLEHRQRHEIYRDRLATYRREIENHRRDEYLREMRSRQSEFEPLRLAPPSQQQQIPVAPVRPNTVQPARFSVIQQEVPAQQARYELLTAAPPIQPKQPRSLTVRAHVSERKKSRRGGFFRCRLEWVNGGHPVDHPVHRTRRHNHLKHHHHRRL